MATEHNLYRLWKLTTDQGTEIVRMMLDESVPNLQEVLVQEKKTIRRVKKLSQVQYNFLFHGNPRTSADLDLVLVIILLKNLKDCEINPNFIWHVLPQPGDMSREADLCRLLFIRNELVHVPSTTAIDDVDFNKKWSEIEQILIRLNGSLKTPVPNLEDRIDELKSMTFLQMGKGKIEEDKKDTDEETVFMLKNELEEMRKKVTLQEDNYDPGIMKFRPETESRFYETGGKGGLFTVLNDEIDREGSVEDRKKLIQFFRNTLNFDVLDMNDCGDINIIDFLAKAKDKAKGESDKYYCLVFFIGCHGSKKHLYFKDRRIKFEEIKNGFNGKNLKQYRGRPKIFLTQFCRGELNEYGGVPVPDAMSTANLRGNENADILVLFSTVKENVAWRSPNTGSIIVDKCVETFSRDWRDHHLEEMMLTVRGKVADWIYFDMDFLVCRQTAVVESSLTKRLLFRRSLEE